jgi:hypothetical protein
MRDYDAILLRKTAYMSKWYVNFIFQNGRREGSRRLLARQKALCPNYLSETASTVCTNLSRIFFNHRLGQSPDRGEDISIGASGNGRLPDSTIDLAITEKLDISPFHSIRSLALTIKRSPTTVWTHLRCMGFVIKHLQFVPHTLSSIQKMNACNIQ